VARGRPVGQEPTLILDQIRSFRQHVKVFAHLARLLFAWIVDNQGVVWPLSAGIVQPPREPTANREGNV